MGMSALPPPDHGVLILLSMLGVWRETKGVSWCKKKGVGAARVALHNGRTVTRNVLIAAPLGSRTLDKTFEEAEAVLAANCRVCGRCEMAGK